MGEFCIRNRLTILLLALAATLAFGAATITGFTRNLPQASMELHGDAFRLQEIANREFPPEFHIVPLGVFAHRENENILTKQTLEELLGKSEALRNSSFGREFLRDFVEPGLTPDFVRESYHGFVTIADITNVYLAKQGLSLSDASAKQVEDAVADICNDPQFGFFFRSRLSIKSEIDQSACSAPAFFFYVFADNARLGGGPFHRSVGADPVMLAKERFNRNLQTALQGDSYELLGIGIDLNLEANDEGFSSGTILRIFGIIGFLALFVGFMLRSWRIGLVTIVGLFVLIIWIRGFPIIVSTLSGGFVKPSLTTDVILPIAYIAIAVDYIIHIAYSYKKEWQLDVSARTAMSRALTGVAAAIGFAAATDAIAFASNTASRIEAVISFGVTGWFAALAAFFLVGIVMPLVIMMWDEKRPARFTPRELPMIPIVRKILTHRILILGLVVLMTAGSVWGITKLDTKLDPRDFISGNSDFVRSLDKREVHFVDSSGKYIRGEEAIIYIKGDLDDPAVTNAIQEVLGNLSRNTFLVRSDQGLIFPKGTELVRNDVASSGQIVVELLDTRKLENIKEAQKQLELDLIPMFGIVETYGITGSPFVRLESLDAVTSSLTNTLAVAAIFILAFLWVAFRSLRFALLTMIPMAFVITWTYGLMGIVGFPLNFITATIAAVSIGVGINYAIYLVQRFRQEVEQVDIESGLEKSWQHTGFPVLLSAITSIGGFLVLATAPMPMFATYGILAASMIAFSLAAAMMVLPILISRTSPRKQ